MASDAEIVRAAFDAALAPYKELLLRLLGPGADRLGAILAARLGVYGFEDSMRLLKKLKQICEETDFEPKAVPLKKLLPIFENASLEEDADLHDKWTNLLANEATDDGDVLFAFPSILSQLSSREAMFLDTIYDQVLRKLAEFTNQPGRGIHPAKRLGTKADLVKLYRDLFGNTDLTDEVVELQCSICLDNLRRLRLLEGPYAGMPNIGFTSLGLAFVGACRWPMPKALQLPTAND
jgi:hypothetical protein